MSPSRNRSHSIYGLVDPRTLEVRYVGQTCNRLGDRLAEHVNAARRAILKHRPKQQWICDLLASGHRPTILLLEVITGEGWREAERRWMASYPNLLNAKAGGGGGSWDRLGGLPDWALEKLGKVGDAIIAEQMGVSRKAITYYRKQLGIAAAFDRTRNTPPPRNDRRLKLPEACIVALGTAADEMVAALYGVSKRTINRNRRARGIPSYAKVTGNDGRIRVGEPHRRWRDRPQPSP